MRREKGSATVDEKSELTEVERRVLQEVDSHPCCTCTDIGERVFASCSTIGTVRNPQVWARPAGRVLHRLLAKGFVTRAWISHYSGDARPAWKITSEGWQALARAMHVK